MAGKLRKGLFIAGVGCLSIILLAVGVVGIGFLGARVSVGRRGEPTAEPMEQRIALGSGPAPVSGVPADSLELSPAPSPSLRLAIELREGVFEIRPGPVGSDVTIAGTYSKEYYELTEERGGDGSGAQSVALRLLPTASLFTRMLAGLTSIGDDHPNHLVITIPRGMPTDLDLRLSEGRSESDLGGLRLTRLDTLLSKGAHRLEFSEPLDGNLEHAVVRTMMGDSSVAKLGNAHPRDLRVESRMGSFQYDLSGAWPQGSESSISITHSMGDLNLHVPRDVRLSDDSSNTVIFGGTNSLRAGRDNPEDPAAPTLLLKVSTRMGGTQISRD